nr:hypothetical protein CFP56_65979 [Quercus suber]
MANLKTVRLLRAYASDDRSTLRIDFARAKMKMSGHNVLTQSQGKVRRNQSLLLELAGGPFYLVNFTFLPLRGCDERATVSLLDAHNIGKIGCKFI